MRVGVKLVEFTAASKQWAGLSNNVYDFRTRSESTGVRPDYAHAVLFHTCKHMADTARYKYGFFPDLFMPKKGKNTRLGLHSFSLIVTIKLRLTKVHST